MATLTQGQVVSVQLAEGESYTVTPSGAAQISTRGISGGQLENASTFSASKTFGPYQEAGSLSIACVSGSLTYSQVGGPVYQDPATGTLVGAGGRQISTLDARRGSQLRRGFPLLRCPGSTSILSGLGAGGGGGTAPTYQVTTRNNRKCLEITFQNHTNPQTVFWSIPSRKYSNKLHYTFELEDALQWNGGFLGCQYSKDGNFTDNVRHTYNIGRNTGWSGIHCVSPAVSEFTGTGTSATPFTSNQTTDTMTYASFRGTRSASGTGTTRVWLYEAVESETQSLPQIVIGADDGHMTWYTDGLPILEKYGFSSYLAYIRDDQDGSTRMRDSVEWVDAINRGHHALVHGCKTGVASLADYFSSYAGYGSPQAAMRADIEYNRDGMVAAGLDPTGRGRRIYVLPQGYHQPSGGAGDSTIIAAVTAAGMVAARRATVEGSILVNGGQSSQALYLPIIGHNYAGGSESTNISTLVSSIQTEVANGRSVVLMFHEVRSSPSLSEQITQANLETIVAACQALVQSGAARAGNFHDLADELQTYQGPVSY